MNDVKQAQICRGTWAHGEKSGSARFTKHQVEAARRIVIEFRVPATLLAEALGMTNTRVIEWLTKSWDTSKWDGLENPLNQPDDGGHDAKR